MDIIKELSEGNSRYLEKFVARRREVALAQYPKAVVIACSDSRVCPELIFDQGIGDLFVIRVAGNILNNENIGSIEYAVEHLKVPLVIVLGHSRCGAVAAAAVDVGSAGGDAHGHVKSVIDAITPAVVEAKKTCEGEDLVGEAVLINIKMSVKKLESIFKNTKVVGAHYDLDTGKVSWCQAPNDRGVTG